jgi:DNA-binding protein H-NS
MFTETNQSHSELHQSLGKTQYLPGIMYMRLRTLNRELQELEEFLVTRRQTEKYQMVQLKEALVKRIEKYFKQLDDSNAGVFRQVEDDLRSMRLTLAEMESDLTKFS